MFTSEELHLLNEALVYAANHHKHKARYTRIAEVTQRHHDKATGMSELSAKILKLQNTAAVAA